MRVFRNVGCLKAALAAISCRLGLMAVISLLTAACATESANQAGSVSTASDGSVAQTHKQQCRSEKRTGTNFPKRMCKSTEEWAAIDSQQHGDAYDYTRQIFENGAVGNAKNNGAAGSNMGGAAQ